MHCSGAREQLSKLAFEMKEVETLPASVLEYHGYVQRADSECRREHCIWYHSYSISENLDLSDATAFAYGDGIALGSKKNTVSLQSGLYQQEGDSDVEAVMGDEFNEGLDMKTVRKRNLFATTLEADQAPEDDPSMN